MEDELASASRSEEGETIRPTPICAIGASAGGIQALQTLFRRLPDDLGLAYVVIIHLSPEHPSALSEILSGHTRMPVHQVTDTPHLSPNCVYVIPPDRELVIDGDDVRARPFSEPRGQRAPVDVFFRSVAAARGDGMAVVLSGAGSDGALGVRAIKEAGGIIFVQEPADAEFPMMPRSALATGAADFVAPVPRLVERMTEIARSKDAVRRLNADEADHDLNRIVEFLRGRTGHDFSSYKRATVRRRVARRMQVTRRSTLDGYAGYMVENPEEAQELFGDLLISVTQFFRDPASYEALAGKAIGPIFDEAGEDGIRAWVAGCATGEEAYSLAILMLEERERRGGGVAPPIQIFATDLDEGALGTGREGRYPLSIEADVSDERLRRFFMPEGAHYRIRKEVRDCVLFATHSVLKDPPFMRMDLISCRNLLIYMERELQRQVCTLYHYGLRQHGFLFLGSAETTDAAPDIFFPVDRKARIYRARPVARRSPPILSNLPPGHRPDLVVEHDRRARRGRRLEPEAERAPGAGHLAALEQAAPPGALVDHAHRVIHLSPTAGRFLLPVGGPFDADLTMLVRPELRPDLRSALRRALERSETVLSLPLPVAFNGSKRRVMVHVAPVTDGNDAPPHQALVSFLDAGPVEEAGEPGEPGGGDEVRRLREELRNIEERLAASRNEHETSLQDLRVANEELQSINEEYRSTAEELETSKEELQSMNEELQTVNTELKGKLESIATAHSDLQNLVTSTEIGTLFLDPHLRIRMLTPVVSELFSVTEADIGRQITDFTHRLKKDGLATQARRVLRDLAPVEHEVETDDGQWLMMRLRPYRTVDDRIDGIVVTFIDVTDRKRADMALAAEIGAMARLQRLSTRIIEAEALEPPLAGVLDAALELVGADCGCVQLIDHEARRVRIAVERGLGQGFLDRFGDMDLDQETPCTGSPTGGPMLIEDYETDPGSQDYLDVARSIGIRAQASVPLYTTAGRMVGVLNTNFHEPQTFTDQQARLLSICARQAADAINAHRLQEKLRRSELRLRKVLETDAVGVMFWDDGGTLVGANDAFLAMTGYTRAQVANRELTWRHMTPPEWIPESEAELARLTETGRLGPYEKEYVGADGERRWMLLAGRRVEENFIAEYAIDISDRKRAEAERELLSRELSHRVKNTLAVVQALARQTDAATVEDFREALAGRLDALAKAHSLLLESDWQSADLGDLVRDAVAAYGGDGDDEDGWEARVIVEGPPLTVSARQALGISLVLHELATNALKYGALSSEAGRVEIGWRQEPGGEAGTLVRFTWAERGGPAPTPPAQAGFGTQLIQRASEYDLGGEAEMDWGPEGLTCVIVFPEE